MHIDTVGLLGRYCSSLDVMANLSRRSEVLTVLLTDIEGSTQLWDQHHAAMAAALQTHDSVLSDEISRAGGIVVTSRGEGDSFFAVFPLATGAVSAALAIQQRLATTNWPDGIEIRVRIAVNTGEVDLRNDDYFGSAINRAARIRALAKGGQTLVGSSTASIVGDLLPRSVSLIDRGSEVLRGLRRPEQIFELASRSSNLVAGASD